MSVWVIQLHPVMNPRGLGCSFSVRSLHFDLTEQTVKLMNVTSPVAGVYASWTNI